MSFDPYDATVREGSMQGNPYSILVVDDEPTILDTVRAYLEQEGYTVHTAVDGPSALKAARAFLIPTSPLAHLLLLFT
jgi:CheY-like chemotaxis protein